MQRSKRRPLGAPPLHLSYTARLGAAPRGHDAPRWRAVRVDAAFAEQVDAFRAGDADTIAFTLGRLVRPRDATGWKVLEVVVYQTTGAPAPAVAIQTTTPTPAALGAAIPVGELQRYETLDENPWSGLAPSVESAEGTWSFDYGENTAAARTDLKELWLLVRYGVPPEED